MERPGLSVSTTAGVRNVLAALGGRSVRIALMTAIGVTNRDGDYNRTTEAHDWKRRGERLVRVSGLPYTIVRPGWFDYNKLDEHQLVLLQGDRRHAGDPSDGVIARRQIAEVLVASLTSDEALRKTFELVATQGPAQHDLDEVFARLDADPPGAVDGVRDLPNMPPEERARSDCERTSNAERSFTYERGHSMENVVVVIGAGQIGQAIARRVGVGKHIVLADRSEANANAAAEVMANAGYQVSVATVDVSSRETVQALVGKATGIGEIVGLIHAAGVSPSQASPETILHVDLYGTAVVLEEFGKVDGPRWVRRGHLVAVRPSPARAHHRAEQGAGDDAHGGTARSCRSSNSIR